MEAEENLNSSQKVESRQF